MSLSITFHAPGHRRRELERELSRTRAVLDAARYQLRHAERELAYCRPRSSEEWRVLYGEQGWPDRLPCGWCGGPHDELDHEALGR